MVLDTTDGPICILENTTQGLEIRYELPVHKYGVIRVPAFRLVAVRAFLSQFPSSVIQAHVPHRR